MPSQTGGYGRYSPCRGNLGTEDRCNYVDTLQSVFNRRVRHFPQTSHVLWENFDDSFAGQHVENTQGCQGIVYYYNATSHELTCKVRDIADGTDGATVWTADGGNLATLYADGIYHAMWITTSPTNDGRFLVWGHWAPDAHANNDHPYLYHAITNGPYRQVLQIRSIADGSILSESGITDNTPGGGGNPDFYIPAFDIPLSDSTVVWHRAGTSGDADVGVIQINSDGTFSADAEYGSGCGGEANGLEIADIFENGKWNLLPFDGLKMTGEVVTTPPSQFSLHEQPSSFVLPGCEPTPVEHAGKEFTGFLSAHCGKIYGWDDSSNSFFRYDPAKAEGFTPDTSGDPATDPNHPDHPLYAGVTEKLRASRNFQPTPAPTWAFPASIHWRNYVVRDAHTGGDSNGDCAQGLASCGGGSEGEQPACCGDNSHIAINNTLVEESSDPEVYPSSCGPGNVLFFYFQATLGSACSGDCLRSMTAQAFFVTDFGAETEQCDAVTICGFESNTASHTCTYQDLGVWINSDDIPVGQRCIYISVTARTQGGCRKTEGFKVIDNTVGDICSDFPETCVGFV